MQHAASQPSSSAAVVGRCVLHVSCSSKIATCYLVLVAKCRPPAKVSEALDDARARRTQAKIT